MSVKPNPARTLSVKEAYELWGLAVPTTEITTIAASTTCSLSSYSNFLRSTCTLRDWIARRRANRATLSSDHILSSIWSHWYSLFSNLIDFRFSILSLRSRRSIRSFASSNIVLSRVFEPFFGASWPLSAAAFSSSSSRAQDGIAAAPAASLASSRRACAFAIRSAISFASPPRTSTWGNSFSTATMAKVFHLPGSGIRPSSL